jgi:hypothetical protein
MSRLNKELLGASPQQISRQLSKFSRAARLVSSQHARLVGKHPNEWVAFQDGKVFATDPSFNGLVRKLKKRGLSASETIIRYIDTSGRKLIL